MSEKPIIKTRSLFLTALLLAAPALRAQIVNDGATNTLSNVTNTFTGDVTVGTNGSFTLLVLSDNSLLTNSAQGVIGRNATARSNEVRLISASARWRMGNDLYVGNNGAMNRLVVSNGAFLANNNGLLGNGASSSNNFALVTGSGSFWSNRTDLTVGSSGRDNQLIVSNGALVASRIGNLGLNSGSSNNLVVVTGNGSYWSNQVDLNVGVNERGNRLVIEAGGLAGCDNGRVGAGVFSDGSEALVTGPGSLWSIRTDLAVGLNSANNRLVVSNGAAVVSGNNGRVGVSGPATGNQVLVTGAGSSWSNQFELYVGEGNEGNRLEVNSGGRVVSSNTYVGYQGAGNFALITGASSLLSNRADLFVGHSSSGNVLIASNGATVSAGNGFIGFNSTASSNSATVTGPGTSWLVASNLYVGSNAAFNRLIVSNGGFVKNLSGFIGYASSSSNNLAVVTGSGSMWSNAIDLIIGRNGPGNQLVISNGATVQSVRAYLGLNVLCNNNLAVVTGAGSVCKGSSLFLGGGGSSNRLVVSDGGVVQDSAGSIGSDPSANYNVAVVTGSGSTWSNSSVLSVGDFGDGNQLVVSNGGAVFARSSVVLGSNPSSLSNRIEVNGGSLLASNASATALFDIRRGTNVFNAGLIDVDRLVLTNALGKFEFNGGTLVTRGAFINNNAAFNVGNSGGTPAVWDVRAGVSNHFVADYLVVGERASFNQLLVTNGAFLTNGIDAVIGDSFGANSNSAVISGAGSRWAANGNLDIGYFGSFNRLVISNGGVVANATGELGNASTSSNNFALVTGAGSLWTNRQELRVGVGGGGNQLVVSNGGTVFTMATRSLGFISGANSNTVTVTDAGSRWLGDGTLYVGSDSAFNRLTVANGGLVTSGLGVFGRVSSSSNNVALVTGSESLWTNSGELYVGDFGSGNLLVVSNGGTVFAMFNRYIGNNTGANSNTVIVTGADSRWLRDDSLFLGNGGAFNRLVVSDGAQVLSGTAGLGFFSGGNSNQVVVTGAGSLWSNRFDLFVGDGGSANLLVVSNGARVVNSNGFVAAGVSGALGSNNTALVTGAGSIWSNRASLTVGVSGSGNRLTVSNGAMVSVGVGAFLGVNSTSTGNRLVVDGSTLLVTNVAGTGLLDIRRGTNVLNSGLIEADILRMTNVGGFFQFNGGTLSARNSRVSNGNFLLIGNGTSPATFILAGNGLHEFTGILFATVSSNATFTGNGTIGGAVPLQLSAGSRLVPGTSVGKMIFSNSPALQGATIMEISKNGAALTNDQIQVTAPLTYGGSLTVSNLGPTALAIGDRFPLFSASSYAGAFTNITLPPLAFGLAFTNKLGVDGSLEVFSSAPPSPTLTIQRSNDVLFVSWPTSASNFCLETTFDLSSPVVWKTVTSGIITNGSSFVFSLANLSALPKQFFRLAFPCSTALTPVSLSIQLSNNLVTLSWPSNAFRLETTFSVAPPVSWQTISNGINNSGPLRAFTFTNNPAVTNQFFRLAFP